jgi:hypothetical protein
MLRSPLLGRTAERNQRSVENELAPTQARLTMQLAANLVLLWMGLLTAVGVIFIAAGIIFLGGRLLRR